MRMYQVDAFTSELFKGNPAAVLILEEWPQEALMLAIAQENNLAETAFARRRIDGDWDLRWFTPAHEAEFCGHATLATAHVLATEYGFAPPLAFNTRVGALRVTKGEYGYVLDLPRLEPEVLDELPVELGNVFAEMPVCIFRNFENMYCDLGSAEAVRQFVPNLVEIARLGPLGLVVTGKGAVGEEADFVSRYFAPNAGIPEDPVTGSVHATLVPYWSRQLSKTPLLAYQASARGGWLVCELSEDRVLLNGDAVTFFEAEIRLPGS